MNLLNHINQLLLPKFLSPFKWSWANTDSTRPIPRIYPRKAKPFMHVLRLLLSPTEGSRQFYQHETLNAIFPASGESLGLSKMLYSREGTLNWDDFSKVVMPSTLSGSRPIVQADPNVAASRRSIKVVCFSWVDRRRWEWTPLCDVGKVET